MKKAISLILVLAMLLTSVVFAFAESGFESEAFQKLDALKVSYEEAKQGSNPAAGSKDVPDYSVDENAYALPLIGILPWADEKDVVLFSKDGTNFAPFLTAKPGEKIYVKANSFSLDLRDRFFGTMPETLTSKTTPAEVTLEKLYDLVSLDESGRANTGAENMIGVNLLKGSNMYGWNLAKGFRNTWEDPLWLKAIVNDEDNAYQYTTTVNGLYPDVKMNYYARGEAEGKDITLSPDGVKVVVTPDYIDLPTKLADLVRRLGIETIDYREHFNSGDFGFDLVNSTIKDTSGYNIRYSYHSPNYGTGINGSFFVKSMDEAIKETMNVIATLHDFVANFRTDWTPTDGELYTVNVGLDGYRPYAQINGAYQSSDASKLWGAADFSAHGSVLTAEYDLQTSENSGAYVNGLFKDVKAVVKLNASEYLTTEFNNAVIRVLEQAGEKLDKDFTIELRLEAEPKNGEAGVYSFKMPDRMVTADDFSQGYLKDITFYNNTDETKTVLVKDGEFGEVQELVVEAKQKATITVSDGQKTYIDVDAVPTTMSDKFLGTNDIEATFGKTLALGGGAVLDPPGERELTKHIYFAYSALEAEAALAVTDATTYNLGGNGVCTGDKVVILNDRYSLAGMLSVRPFVGVLLSLGSN